MNPGYIMVDCGGLNLNDSTKQSIEGLYSRSKEAMATGKPVIVYNCVMSGAPCTPTCVIAWEENDSIIATGHVLRITIKEGDDVTVTNLVAG